MVLMRQQWVVVMVMRVLVLLISPAIDHLISKMRNRRRHDQIESKAQRKRH